MIPVGPYGDFGSDHPDGKGTFAKRKMARPSTGKPLAAYVSTVLSCLSDLRVIIMVFAETLGNHNW